MKMEWKILVEGHGLDKYPWYREFYNKFLSNEVIAKELNKLWRKKKKLKKQKYNPF